MGCTLKHKIIEHDFAVGNTHDKLPHQESSMKKSEHNEQANLRKGQTEAAPGNEGQKEPKTKSGGGEELQDQAVQSHQNLVDNSKALGQDRTDIEQGTEKVSDLNPGEDPEIVIISDDENLGEENRRNEGVHREHMKSIIDRASTTKLQPKITLSPHKEPPGGTIPNGLPKEGFRALGAEQLESKTETRAAMIKELKDIRVEANRRHMAEVDRLRKIEIVSSKNRNLGQEVFHAACDERELGLKEYGGMAQSPNRQNRDFNAQTLPSNPAKRKSPDTDSPSYRRDCRARFPESSSTEQVPIHTRYQEDVNSRHIEPTFKAFGEKNSGNWLSEAQSPPNNLKKEGMLSLKHGMTPQRLPREKYDRDLEGRQGRNLPIRQNLGAKLEERKASDEISVRTTQSDFDPHIQEDDAKSPGKKCVSPQTNEEKDEAKQRYGPSLLFSLPKTTRIGRRFS